MPTVNSRKYIMNFVKRFALLSFFMSLALQGFSVPAKLVKNDYGATQLAVNGAPMLLIAGELMNSSASTKESMQERWQNLEALNLNTVLMSVTWQQIEPKENVYDFSVVESHIKEARARNLKIVFLWFGSWKNGVSGYAPDWVLRDTKRFARIKNAKGENRPALSPFNKNLLDADKKAYCALLSKIKQLDENFGTVIMVQIQNEIGLLDDSRDRSEIAESEFKKDVPAPLLKNLSENFSDISKEIAEQWQNNGKPLKGSWQTVFGNTSKNLADEIFMAWHFAKFVEEIAQAGKKVYPIPVFVNAWIVWPNQAPGNYPSGGPNARMLDIWKAAAPSVDIFAVDNYADSYKSKCLEYMRRGNPLFVPEAVALWKGDKTSAPAKAFYTFAQNSAICFSPFAIDHSAYKDNLPLKNAYALIKNLSPIILKMQGSKDLVGFMQDSDKGGESFDFKDVIAHVNYGYQFKGYGLIARISQDEFLVAGTGINVSFESKIPNLKGMSYGLIKEGKLENGKWKTLKYLGGDEAFAGIGGVRIPATYLPEDAKECDISATIIKIIPVESTSAKNSLIF